VSRDGIEAAISMIAPSGEREVRGVPRAGLRFGSWLSRVATPPSTSLVAPATGRGDPAGDDPEVPWLEYEVSSADSARRCGLAVGEDGAYELVIAHAATPSEMARCFCAGRLDDDQRAAIAALFTAELVEAYSGDGKEPGESDPVRRVCCRARTSAEDRHRFELGSGRARRAPLATLTKTLDGIVTELLARGEYCSDEDRAVARSGEWTLSLEE